MKRKKLIKQKKEELNKIDVQIIDIMAALMKIAVKPNSNPFELAYNSLKACKDLERLRLQRAIIASQPIPPKFKSGGISYKVDSLTIIGEEKTERILNPYGKKIKDGQAVYIVDDKKQDEISKKLDKIIKAVKTKKE